MERRYPFGFMVLTCSGLLGWPTLPYGWDHPRREPHKRQGKNIKIPGVPGKFKRRKK